MRRRRRRQRRTQKKKGKKKQKKKTTSKTSTPEHEDEESDESRVSMCQTCDCVPSFWVQNQCPPDGLQFRVRFALRAVPFFCPTQVFSRSVSSPTICSDTLLCARTSRQSGFAPCVLGMEKSVRRAALDSVCQVWLRAVGVSTSKHQVVTIQATKTREVRTRQQELLKASCGGHNQSLTFATSTDTTLWSSNPDVDNGAKTSVLANARMEPQCFGQQGSILCNSQSAQIT